ncbi:MAG: hypothetical protein K5675_06865 [Lachnospiraceae bacterium]|nr:hypothetical protein [Lachnospiraceae bacterium]
MDYKGNTKRKAPAGTIHGGIECINGQYYIFYHRCTNDTDFSRQACAEPIEILEDGSIPQVGITTQGLNGAPLKAQGTFPAAICCYLYNDDTKNVQGVNPKRKQPVVTATDGEMYVTAVTDRTKIGYRNFIGMGSKTLKLSIRGDEGRILVYSEEDGKLLGETEIIASKEWQIIEINHKLPMEESMLLLEYQGSGTIDLKEVYFL